MKDWMTPLNYLSAAFLTACLAGAATVFFFAWKRARTHFRRETLVMLAYLLGPLLMLFLIAALSLVIRIVSQ